MNRASGLVLAALATALFPAAARAADPPPPVMGHSHRELVLAAPLSAEGDHQADWIEERAAVAVIELDGDYDRELPDGTSNVVPRSLVAREFFAHNPDDFDFLVVFSTFEFDAGPALAFAWVVRNDVEGIGLPQFDQSDQFGSAGRLQTYVDMRALGSYGTDPLSPEFEHTLTVLTHELAHRWGSHVRFRRPDGSLSDELLGPDGTHWSFLLDSGGSLHYGNDWRDNGDGTFTSVGALELMSPLDLYLAGFYAPGEVPPMTLIEAPGVDPSRLPEPGVTIAGTASTVTVEDIVAAEGPRLPPAGEAQRDFRAAFVLIKRPGETIGEEQILGIDRIRRELLARFSVLTGGRGLLQVFPQAVVETPGVPGGVGGGDPRPGGSNVLDALAWLRGRQAPEGWWEDRPSTRVRDTAEALVTLTSLDPLFTGAAPAAAWLAAQPETTVDSLARTASALARVGEDASTAAARLAALQNPDGGWGVAAGYASDPLDTALAAAALAAAGGPPAAIAGGVAYLETVRRPDGGWSSFTGGPGRAGVTDAALRALDAAGAGGGEADPAVGWLAGKQNPDGGFGDSPSTVHDTAGTLETLMSIEAVGGVDGGAAAAYLDARQTVEGSWAGSVYSTALAATALRRFNFPNWSFAGSPSAEPESPRDGERVTLRFTVANDGNALAPPGVLRLYEGDPGAGGVAVGDDVALPPLAAGQQAVVTLLWDSRDRAGARTLTAVVDPDGAVPELSETDNGQALTLDVLPAPAGAELELRAPDLLITPAQPTELPAELTIAAAVRNLGQTDATGLVVRLLVGEDGAETPVGEVTIDVPARSSSLAAFTYTLTAPGITRFTVVADPDGAIAEEDEGNNAASRTVATGATLDFEIAGSDLELVGTPYLGTDVTFRVTVRNRGTLDSPDTDLRLTVTDGVTVREVALNSIQLAGGAAATFEILWRVDLEGDLELVAEVDPDGLVPETAEGNNQATLEFTAGALDVANLEVSFQDLVFDPDPGEEGRPLTLSILVRNTGGEPVTGAEVAFYDGDPGAGGVQIEGRATIASLDPGEEATATVVWQRVPTAADRLIFAVADPDDLIEEFREDDNAAFETLVVLGLPDPAVSPAALDLEPPLPQPGEPATLTVTVSNLGQQGVENLVVRAFDGDPDLGGLPLGDQVIGSLAGDGSAITAFTWSPAGGERRPVVVVLDPDGAVEEASEANNRAAIDLVAQDGDFVVSERWFSPDGDGVRDETTLVFRLEAPTDAEVQVIDAERDLVVRRAAFPGTTGDQFTWDGRDDLGRLVRDADYLLRLVDAAGAAADEAIVTLDTNRLSLLRTAGTPFHAVTNLTCELPTTGDLVGTADESWFYFAIAGTTDPIYPRGIYRVRPDGSELTQIITAGFFGSRSPNTLVVSPDGSLIAFRASGGAPFRVFLYVANGDGSGPLQLGDPAVSSPDQPFGFIDGGEALLVRRNSVDWVKLPLDGFTPESVLYEGLVDDRDAVFSPDHRRLAFRERLADEIVLLDLDTGAAHPLVQEPGFPDAEWVWSPGGERLAVVDHLGDRLAVFDRDGGEVFSLPLPTELHPDVDTFDVLNPAEFEHGVAKSPSWSRSGTELALIVNHAAVGEGCGGVQYMRYLAVDLLTGETSTIGWSEPAEFTSCDLSFHVDTRDGSAWVERGALHYGPRRQEQTFDLSAFLPDAAGEYRVRIRQIGHDLAEVEDVSLLAGGFRVPPVSASVVDGGDALAAVARRDGTPADLHGKTLELAWERPGGDTVELALTAREESFGDAATTRGAASDPGSGPSSRAAAQETGGEATAGGLLPFSFDLLWDPNDRAVLLLPAFEDPPTAVFLDEGSRAAPMLEDWESLSDLAFTPSGRRLVFTSSDATEDPGSACFQRGFEDTFVLRSLLNLTADLRARRTSSSSGVLIEGTAADLNFLRWQIDWARQATPGAWSPVAPPETAPVIDGRFTTWVPPEPGSFLVRLTAEDRAGNRRSDVKRVFSPDTPSITDLYLSPRLFSPNGDGILDRTTVHYRVLQPVHLEFRFTDLDGTPVRTIPRDHATAGTVHEFEWDGRDDAGQPVPDGEYRMTVQSYEFFVTVDNTPPEIGLDLGVDFCLESTARRRLLPVLSSSVTEPHLDSAVVEWGEGADPLVWRPGPGPGPLRLSEYTGRRFRLRAADLAGNQALATTPLADELLVLTDFGRHAVGAGGQLAELAPTPCEFGAFTFDHGAVRIRAAETVVPELAEVMVEFQPVPEINGVPRPDQLDEEGWFASPVGPFPPSPAIPDGTFEVLWDLAGVGIGEYTAVRLAVLDVTGRVHRAEPFGIVTDGVQFNGILRPDPDHPLELLSLVDEAELDLLEDLVLWGSEFVAEPLADVTLVLTSDQDPRYATPVPVAPAGVAGRYFIFHDPDLLACTAYSGYVVVETEPRLDPVTGQLVSRTVTSGERIIEVPCLDLHVFLEEWRVGQCNGPRLSSERGFTLRPRSLDGRPLQLLTLSGPDGNGEETVVFSVNAPESGAAYRFVFDLETLPEGRYPVRARLTNVDGEVAVDEHELAVDNTPPALAITYPAEGQPVCGVPDDGSNVVTIEGTIDDNLGVFFSLEAELAGGLEGGLPIGPGGEFSPCGESLCPEPKSGTPSVHGPLGEIGDVSGTVEARLEVVDEGGFYRCVDRSFDFDGLVDEPFASVDLSLFSPNGDDVADSAAITFGAAEPGTVRVEIHHASAIWAPDGLPCLASGPPARTVASGLPYLDLGQAIWDGRDDGGTVVPDGTYKGFVTFEDGCGNQARRGFCTEIDTTPPELAIDFPTPTSPLPLIVEVVGSIDDEHLQGWALEYGVGSDPETWARIAGGFFNVDPQILAAWNTFGLAGEHTLRLVGLDRVGNRSELGVPLILSTPLELIAALEALPRPFSPNGDGHRESATVRFGLGVDAVVDLTIYDQADQVVRTLLSVVTRGSGEWTTPWNGATDAGEPAPDGAYRAELFARLASEPAVTQRESVTVVLDRTPPAIAVARPLDGAFLPSEGPIQATIEDLLLAEYVVWQTDTPDAPVWIELDRGSTNRVDHVFGALDNLAEGEWALRFEAVDQGESESETVVRFTLDDTPPEVTLAAPAAGAVLTPAEPIEVAGGVEEEHLELWRLEVGAGAEPASWTELAAGTELPVPEPLSSWDPSALADGLYTLRLTARDLAGHETAAAVAVTLDGTAPALDLTVPAEGGYVTGPTVIAGTAADPHLVQYTLAVAPGPPGSSNQFSPLGSGNASVTGGPLLQWLNLPADGVYTLRLAASDRAANAAELLRAVTVDTQPPAAPQGLTATAENGRDGRLVWQPNGESDLAGYHVYRGGVRITAEPLAAPTHLDPDLAEGLYRYTVTAVDLAGQESPPSERADLRIDLTPPLVSIQRPAAGGRVGGLVEVIGTAFSNEDFKEYRLWVGPGDGSSGRQLLRRSPVPIQADRLGDWNTTGQAEDSVHTLILEGEDLAGNVGEALATVTVDNLPPAAPTGLTATADGADVHLAWNPSPEPDLAGYLLYRDGRLANAEGPVVGPLDPYLLGAPAYDDLDRPDGTFTYEVYALDTAGNLSDPSAPAQVTLDNRAPRAVIVNPEEGARFDQSLYVLATSDDTDVEEVRFDFRAVGDPGWTPIAAADTAEPWEVDFTPTGPFGDYELRAVATDEGGQTDAAPPSIVVTYTDVTPPAAPAGLAALVDGGDVALSWDPVTEPDLAGYHLERAAGGGDPVRITAAPVTDTSHVDAGVADGDYVYTVVAVDESDNDSAPSGPAAARVFTPVLDQPYTPTAALATDLAGSGEPSADAELTVDPAGAQAIAPADAAGAFLFTAAPLTRSDNVLGVRQTYGAGHRSKAASVLVLSDQPPSTPTGLTAVAGAGLSAELAWNPNPEPDVVAYRLFRDGEPVPAAEAVSSLVATASSQTSFDPAAQAVDGDPETYWRPSFGTEGVGEWIEVSWAPVRHLVGVDVIWRDFFGEFTTNPGDYDLEAWDGRAWIPILRVRGDTGLERHFDLVPPYRTDRIRLVLRAAPTSPYLAELIPVHAPLIAGTAHTDPTADGSYEYRVAAVDQYGLESALSDPATVEVGDVEGPEPSVLSTAVTGSDVTLTWTASASADVARYELFRDGSKFAEHDDLGALTAVDAGRPNGTWIYTVRGIDQVGNAGEPSNESAAAVAVDPPPAPVALTVAAPPVGGALDLAWQPGAGPVPAGYRVLRSTVAGGPHAPVITVAGTAYRDTGLTNGVTYYYVVRAVDGPGNEGPDSNEASGVPGDLEPPAAPVLHFPGFAGVPATTGAATVRVVGSAEPGAAVTLFRDGVPAGQTTAAAADETEVFALDTFGAMRLSPDGRFAWFGDASDALLLDLSTGVSAPVTFGEEGGVEWLPDSSGVIFGNDDGVRVYRLATGAVSTVVDGVSAVSAVPGPDGRLVVSGFRDGEDGVWLVDPATDTWTRIGTDPWWFVHSFTWSPDGGALAYLRESPQQALEILDLDTFAVSVVAADPGFWPADFSPDGQRLVYQTGDFPARTAIYTLASGVTETLPASTEDQVDAQWWPDGTAVVYIAREEGVDLYDPDAGTVRRLIDVAGTFDQRIAVPPAGRLLAVIDDQPLLLTPAGRFELGGVPIDPGDNAFTAVAADGAGNPGPASAPMVVRRVSAELPDLGVSAGELAVLPAVPLAGSAAQVSAVVRNLGSVASPPADFTLRVLGPAGWAATVADGAVLGPLAPGAAQTVSGSVTLAGGAGVYTLVAAADPLERLAEASETDNRAERTFTAPADGVVTVTAATDRAEYASDQPVAITVEVFDFGDPFSGELTVTVEDAAGFPVTTVLTVPGIDLEYAESAVFTPAWNTGSTFAGVYRVAARLTDAGGAPAAEALAPFTIADFALLAARVQTDRAGYPAGATVRLSGTVDYLAGNGPLSGATARLAVYDAGDELVAEWSQALGDLLPGSSGTVTADWGSAGSPAGAYRVAFAVERAGEALAEAATLFDLTVGAVPVTGSLVLSDHTPPVGLPLQAVLTVVNEGAEPLPATPLRVRLREPVGGVVVAEAETVRDLDPGVPVSAAFDFATEPLGIGNYVAVLSAELPLAGGGTAESTLDAVGFSTTDETPPVVTIELPEPGSVVGGEGVALEAVAIDALSPVLRVEARVDSGAWTPLPPIDGSLGLWGQALAGLAEGAHQVEVRAFDTWNNVGGAGPVAFTVSTAEPELTAAKSWELAADLDGDGVPSPGDRLGYTIVIGNAGGGAATAVALTDPIPADTAVVAGSVTTDLGTVTGEDPVTVAIGELAAGASATVLFEVAVDQPLPAGVEQVSNQGTVTSAELPAVLTDDPDVGGAADPTVTLLAVAPRLIAEKTDELLDDADGDGVPSPGDTIGYAITLRNLGNAAATAVAFADPIPEHTTVVAGSVTASQGTVEGEDPVAVSVGEIAGGGASATVTFAVVIDDPIAAGVHEVVNQGTASSAELADLLTDDPDVAGDADPTVTMIETSPRLSVAKTDLLFTDGDGDGVASPGDELLYQIAIANDGNTAATAAVLTDAVPANASLVAGTVQTSQGTVVSEEPVEIDLGVLPVGTPATVSFRVTIDDPFPLDVLAVENQASLATAELGPVLSDDPDLPGEADPTATDVFITPPASIGDVTVNEGDTGTVDAAFTVSLDHASNRPAVLGWTTADGTAVAGADYQAAAGTVTVPAGEASAVLTVAVIGDLSDEPDETFTVTLADPVGAVLADPEGLGTILDDDQPPQLFVIGTSVTEGDAGTVDAVFTLALSVPSGLPVTVDYLTVDGTAIADTDYQPVAGTAAFPPGTPEVAVPVPVIGDLLDELDEVFQLALANPVNAVPAVSAADGVILDDDEALIAIDDVATDEGDAGTVEALFTVSLTTPSDREIAVDYATVAETATADDDYEPASGTLTFAPGETAATFAVAVVGDLRFEIDETYRVDLAGAVNAGFLDDSGLGTIVDDEACLGPNLLVNPGAERAPLGGEVPGWSEIDGDDWSARLFDPPAFEGDAYFWAGTFEIAELAQDVDLTPYAARIDAGGQEFVFSGAIRVGDEVPPDAARIVVEYLDAGGVLLDAWESPAPADATEWHEVSDLRAAPADARTARVRLLSTAFNAGDNDGYFDALRLSSRRVPTVAISDAPTVYETDVPVDSVFEVTLACAIDGTVAVDFASADGTAVSGQDYQAVAGTLEFAVGESSLPVAVPVLDDTIGEPLETLSVVLAAPVAGFPIVPVLLDAVGDGAIGDQRPCKRSPGYWKNHRAAWPILWLRIGGVLHDADGMQALLDYGGPDASSRLGRHVVAAELNVAAGADPSVRAILDEAHAFLALFPPGSSPSGPDRKEANRLKDLLDVYHDCPCQTMDIGGPNRFDPDYPPGGEGPDGGYCARSPDYWSAFPGQWPDTKLDLGASTYGQDQLQGFLDYAGDDASTRLARHLTATKLNVLAGGDFSIKPTVDAADEMLKVYPPGSEPKDEDKEAVTLIKEQLDDYNNTLCE